MTRFVPFVLVPQLHGSNRDSEDDESLSDEQTRPAFVRKVYGIVLCQIAYTICIFSILQYFESFVLFLTGNIYIHYLFLAALALVGYFSLTPLEAGTMAHSYPHNYIRLFIFTTIISLGPGLRVAQQMSLIMSIVKFGILCWLIGEIHFFLWLTASFDQVDLIKMITLNKLFYFWASVQCLRLIMKFSIILWFLSNIGLTAIIMYFIQLVIGGRKYREHQENYILSALDELNECKCQPFLCVNFAK